MKFTCEVCGQDHDMEEISFGADCPLPWILLTEEERAASDLGSDDCVIRTRDASHYFIRACLDIPVETTGKSFTWGVWCSLSEASFEEVVRLWSSSDRVNSGPYFGWLCTAIPQYPDTMYLEANVHQREVGQRPYVVLEESDHLLSVHQRVGIEKSELIKIVTEVLHQAR